MSGKPTKIQVTLDKALDGDQAAIDLLSLQPVEVTYRHTRPLTLADLKKDYQQVAQMYKAANLIEVGCLEMVACKAMRYISFLVKEKFDHTFTEEETTVEVTPLMKAMKRAAGDLTLTNLTEDDSPVEEEEEERKEEPQPTKKKTKKKFDLKIRKRSREDSSSSSSSSSDGEGEEPKEKKKRTSGKQKHHAQVKCPFKRCAFDGSDIKRHLTLVHVKAKKEVEEEDIPRLAAIFKAGKGTRGPSTTSGKKKKLGKMKKWCPVPGCFFITPNIHHHIKYKHKAKKDTVEYRVHLANARPYKGLTPEVNLIINKSFHSEPHDPQPQPNQTPGTKKTQIPKLKRNVPLKPRHHHHHLSRMNVPARNLIPLPLMTWTTTPRAKVGVRPATTLPLPTSIVPAICGFAVTLATCAYLMPATSRSKIVFSTFARWPNCSRSWIQRVPTLLL